MGRNSSKGGRIIKTGYDQQVMSMDNPNMDIAHTDIETLGQDIREFAKTTDLPNATQMIIFSEQNPEYRPSGFVKVHYYAIWCKEYCYTKRCMLVDMLVDNPETPHRYMMFDGPEAPWMPGRSKYDCLPVNRGGVFDPSTFAIIGGEWAITNGFHSMRDIEYFLTDFVYDQAYYNKHHILVLRQGSQWGVWDYIRQEMLPCASESVAQSICKVFEGHILIAQKPNDNEQMVDANGTALSKEYQFFLIANEGFIEVSGAELYYGDYDYPISLWGLVASNGTEVVPPIYEQLDFSKELKYYNAERDNKKYILYRNEKGEWVETFKQTKKEEKNN